MLGPAGDSGDDEAGTGLIWSVGGTEVDDTSPACAVACGKSAVSSEVAEASSGLSVDMMRPANVIDNVL